MRLVKDGPAPDEPVVPSEFAELGPKPDDDRLALALGKSLKGKLAFFHSQWKMYENGCWRGRDVYEMRRYIRKELRAYRGLGVSVNQGRIKALASMLEDELFISDRDIIEQQRRQTRYINLRNGLFDLETMEFIPEHDPSLYFTTQLDFDYDPDAECPTFRRYLKSSLVKPGSTENDYSLTMLVQEALAYSMTARTDLKSSFWLVGQKDSGKSTFIALIKAMMGDLHTTIDLTQLGVNRFLLAGIAGKRVLTFTEASSSTMLPDALYKALTGGSDEIYADVKNRDPITFRPEAKVWWAMNEMPRVGDRSGATTRRIVIIPFNRSIPASERILNLEDRLMAERSGIFNALIPMLKRVTAQGGFDRCEQSEALLQEYIMENDTEATFLEECAERHESYRTRSSELYKCYAGWCIANGFKAKNSNQIAKDWRRLGLMFQHSNGSWWHGVKVTANF
jgi:putative DNA primase/helicase